jgi:hypothetical protein
VLTDWKGLGLLHVHRKEASVVDFSGTNDTIKKSISQRKIAVKLTECGFGLYISESLISQRSGIRGKIARWRLCESVETSISDFVASIKALIQS